MTRPSGFPEGGGGGGDCPACEVSTARTAWVDAEGSDGTGVVGEAGKPYATHTAAIAAVAALAVPPSATDPAAVLTYPGVYPESPLTVPSFVTIRSMAGFGATVIEATTTTAALVTCADESAVDGYTLRGASGVGGVGLSVAGLTGEAAAANVFADDCETGFSADGATSTLVLLHATVENCGTGIALFGAATVNAAQLTMSPDGDVPVSARTTGTGCTIVLTGAMFDAQTIDISDGSEIRGYMLSIPIGREGFVGLDASTFGVLGAPGRISVGNGPPTAKGLVALTNTDLEVGTWADITDGATSAPPAVAPVALLPGTTDGSSLYVGMDEPGSGVVYFLVAAAVYGAGSIVSEYWNGVAWVPIGIMVTGAEPPYASEAESVMERAGALEVMRTDAPELTANSAAKALDGITKHWVRLRADGAITSPPVGFSILSTSNLTFIDFTGPILHFGEGVFEDIISLVSHGLVGPGTPAAQNVQYSTEVTLSVELATYSGSSLDGKGSTFEVPAGADTSRPFVLVIPWHPNDAGAGNVEFTVHYSVANAGDVYDGSIVAQTELVTVAAPGVASEVVLTEVPFRVPTTRPGGRVTVAVKRDGGNGADTYADAIHVEDLTIKIDKWRV